MIDDICFSVHIFAKHRPRDVTAISIRFPTGVANVEARVSQRLADFGLDGVTVYVHAVPAPPSLVSVEFST
jgi:hypothetical protein